MIPIPPTPPEGSTPAAFNSAVAILMRLDGILQNIKQVSLDIGEKYANWHGQRKKYRLVKDLYVQSMPLIKELEDKEKIKELFYNIKLATVPSKSYPNDIDENEPAYSSKVERELDDVIIFIEECLQEEGYLMPSAQDKRGLQ